MPQLDVGSIDGWVGALLGLAAIGLSYRQWHRGRKEERRREKDAQAERERRQALQVSVWTRNVDHDPRGSLVHVGLRNGSDEPAYDFTVGLHVGKGMEYIGRRDVVESGFDGCIHIPVPRRYFRAEDIVNLHAEFADAAGRRWARFDGELVSIEPGETRRHPPQDRAA